MADLINEKQWYEAGGGVQLKEIANGASLLKYYSYYVASHQLGGHFLRAVRHDITVAPYRHL